MSPQEAKPLPNNDPHPQTIREKAEAFISRIREHDSISTTGGGVEGEKGAGYTEALDEATLRYLVEHKMVIELKEGRVSPSYTDGLDFHDARRFNPAKPDGHFTNPIYVVPGVGQHDVDSQMIGVKSKQGEQTVVLVSEGAHNFSASYFREYLMPGDADVAAYTGITAAKNFAPQGAEPKERYHEMLADFSAQAHKDGIATPKILISHDPNDSDAYAFKTREGRDYIIVPEAKLNAALASPTEMAALQSSMHREEQRIVHKETTAEGVANSRVLDAEASLFGSDLPTINSKPVMYFSKDDIPEVSNAGLKRAVENGTLTAVGSADLRPEASANPIFKTKDAEGHDLPVYVVTGVDSGDHRPPKAMLAKTKEGKEYILINEGYHQWTQEYVKQNLTRSDAEIAADFTLTDARSFADKAKEKTPADADAMEQRYQQLMSSLADKATGMGIPAPKLLVDVVGTLNGKGGEAGGEGAAEISKEGNGYIFIDKYTMARALASDEGLAALKETIGHELSHIRNGDPTPAGVIAHRELAASQAAELRSDLEGGSPLDRGDPVAAARFFEQQIYKEAPDYLREHPGAKFSAKLTDDDMKAISDWATHNKMNGPQDHPPEWTRLAALRDEAEQVKEYERSHTINSQADREAETKWVIEKVMQDLKDKKLISDPGPDGKDHAGLQGTPSTPQAEIAEIRSTLEQAISRPVTVARAPESRPAPQGPQRQV